ncbi:hypothetical protein ACFQFC_17410 [Amorphoplanes digitatis]|uniref:Uncharacterized protein n=1 Tax=Actinoplanes digitatis TaxID=1868 RepID=A0A7W7I402_9ACTN|nr:hypothetical protein [Actinoplanes digitatis]MBB4765992.1 hypothetical protein [Actinoplanes digitatis]BFE75957.1 hypothetical protein GCM10020092_092580 [Actinoplanes digitatis]GID97250.1 hypothetical protein Adi01nite_66620 [Actinoplanes digitatis]
MSESDSIATSTIAVHRGAWDGLPSDVAAMVAPPVIVSSFPLVEAPEHSSARRRAKQVKLRGHLPSAAQFGRHRRRGQP